MRKREIIFIEGVVDAPETLQEALITSFSSEKEGFVTENCYDLIKVMQGFDGRNVKITIESEVLLDGKLCE